MIGKFSGLVAGWSAGGVGEAVKLSIEAGASIGGGQANHLKMPPSPAATFIPAFVVRRQRKWESKLGIFSGE